MPNVSVGTPGKGVWPPPRIFGYHAETIGDDRMDTVAHGTPAMSLADMPPTELETRRATAGCRSQTSEGIWNNSHMVNRALPVDRANPVDVPRRTLQARNAQWPTPRRPRLGLDYGLVSVASGTVVAAVICGVCPDGITLEGIKTLVTALVQRDDLDREVIPVFVVRVHVTVAMAREVLRHPSHDSHALADVVHILRRVVDDVDASEVTIAQERVAGAQELSRRDTLALQ